MVELIDKVRSTLSIFNKLIVQAHPKIFVDITGIDNKEFMANGIKVRLAFKNPKLELIQFNSSTIDIGIPLKDVVVEQLYLYGSMDTGSKTPPDDKDVKIKIKDFMQVLSKSATHLIIWRLDYSKGRMTPIFDEGKNTYKDVDLMNIDILSKYAVKPVMPDTLNLKSYLELSYKGEMLL